MPQAADYIIKGFLYQFNKTLLEILKSQEDSIITVEGIVEDVEIVTSAMMTAIQCKYHEANERFTPSNIFKPLLQMMDHFQANVGANIRYILFAHYPNVSGVTQPNVGKLIFRPRLILSTRTSRRTLRDCAARSTLMRSLQDSLWNSVRRLTIL
jgi:hypothetical protein